MVVLKKLKSSSLLETITASTLLMVIFVIALLVLNNVFSSTVKNDTSDLNNYMHQVQYQYKNNQVSIPLTQTHHKWEVSVRLIEENKLQWLEFKANHTINNKSVTKRFLNGTY